MSHVVCVRTVTGCSHPHHQQLFHFNPKIPWLIIEVRSLLLYVFEVGESRTILTHMVTLVKNQ